MQQYIPLVTGSGGALVVLIIVCWLFFTGKLHSYGEFRKLELENEQLKTENALLRTAVDTERKTVNDQASAGQVNIRVIEALAKVAAGGRAAVATLTAEDLGL